MNYRRLINKLRKDEEGARAALQVQMDDFEGLVDDLRDFRDLIKTLLDTSDRPGDDFMYNLDIRLDSLRDEGKDIARSLTLLKEAQE